MMLDGSLMTVQMTADLEWKDNSHRCKKADIEGIIAEILWRILRKIALPFKKSYSIVIFP